MNDDESLERGVALHRQMFGADQADRPRSPRWARWAKAVLYGELWSSDKLDLRTRSLITIAILASQSRPEQLALHVRGAVSNGATSDEIVEAIQQAGFYAGWANGTASLTVADKVLTELGL